MSKIAFLFPGQGSQTIGMGQAFAKQYQQSQDIFTKADDVLDFSVSDLIDHGTEEQLKQTAYTQPTLLTASMAALQALRSEGIKPDFVAGHSLGEYSALVAADSISFANGLYAVRQRGLFMEEAVPSGQGGMSAVIGLETESLQQVVETISTNDLPVQLANLNAPGQVVISGAREAVEQAGEAAKEAGAKKVIPLEVSGPFHSSLMQPAAEQFKEVLNNIDIDDADIPVIANVTAERMTVKSDIYQNLMKQLYSPVRWEETVRQLIDEGVDTFIEVGPGKVLSGLVKRVHRRANTFAVNDPESLQKAMAKIKEIY